MTTLVLIAILAILAVLLAIVLRQVFRRPLPRPADNVAVKLADARAGDAVSIAGAGENFADLDFTVERRDRYEVGPRRWVELRGQYRGRPVGLYVWEGDELEVALVPDAPRLALAAPAQDTLEHEGKRWRHRFSKEFVLFRDSDTQGAGFQGSLFEEEGGKRLMLIGNGEATVALKLNPADVTIYRR